MKIDQVIVNKKGTFIDAKRMDWILIGSNPKKKNKVRVSIISGIYQTVSAEMQHYIEDYIFSILQLSLQKNDSKMIVKDVIKAIDRYIDVKKETIIKVECYLNNDMLIYTLLNGRIFEIAVNFGPTKIMMNKNKKMEIISNDCHYYYNGKRVIKNKTQNLNDDIFSTFLYMLQMFD